jgi:NTE family protein
MLNKLFKLITIIFLISAFAAGKAFCLDEEKFITDYMWSRFVKLSPPQRPKIALVLGGGGARGFAHLGVLKVFEEEKIPVDLVAGTSIGAIIGAMYCAGVSIDKIENMSKNIGWNDVSNVSHTGILKLFIAENLLSTERLEKYLKENMGDVQFYQLKRPFACVATDLITGEKIILREGDVALAARASSTIPGIFAPVEFGHRFLIDGGLNDNIPTDVARLMGGDFVVSSAISANYTRNSISNVFTTLIQSIYIQGRLFDEENLKLSDYTIRPQVNDISAVDLGSSKECIDAGIIAARKAVTGLKKKILEETSSYYLFE